MCTEEMPHNDTVRRQLSASQGETKPSSTLILDFQPRGKQISVYEKMNFYYLSYSVCAILLRQSWQTNLDGFPIKKVLRKLLVGGENGYQKR